MTTPKIATSPTAPRHDLLTFGLHQVAYVRRVRVMKREVYSVHAADGTPISVVENENLAQDLINQNDLEVVRVH